MYYRTWGYQEWMSDEPWIVWTIQVSDPEFDLYGHLETEFLRTDWRVAAMSLGLVPHDIRDQGEDEYGPGMQWNEWLVRVDSSVPGFDGAEPTPPIPVLELTELLRSEMPARMTWTNYACSRVNLFACDAETMRAEYDDLITPLEAALLPLRVDGTDSRDPWIYTWGRGRDEDTVGTYTMELCDDPNGWDQPWLRLRAGVLPVTITAATQEASALGIKQGYPCSSFRARLPHSSSPCRSRPARTTGCVDPGGKQATNGRTSTAVRPTPTCQGSPRGICGFPRIQ